MNKAMVAIRSLALLLFWVIGVLAVITSAYALTPTQLSARSVSEQPTRRHPPTPSPTLTVTPSSTASAAPTPAPSPALTATPTMRATVPANATPPVKATALSSVMGTAAGSPGRIPGATPPTSSIGSPADPQKGENTILPLAIGIGISAGLLLVAVGLALRIGLMPARKRKLPPSGAAPWQRVRPADLDNGVSSSRSSGQPLALTGVLPNGTSKRNASRMEGLLITKPTVPERRSMALARHFLRPARLKALHTNDSPPVARGKSPTLTRQNNRTMSTIRERARERDKKHKASVLAP